MHRMSKFRSSGGLGKWAEEPTGHEGSNKNGSAAGIAITRALSKFAVYSLAVATSLNGKSNARARNLRHSEPIRSMDAKVIPKVITGKSDSGEPLEGEDEPLEVVPGQLAPSQTHHPWI